MAQVMKLRWEGLTPAQYEQLRSLVRWEEDHPEGAIFHVAWFRDGGVSVLDVWESQEQCDRFMQERLMPGVQKAGVTGEPTISWYEAHAIFNPQALMAATR